MEIDVKCTSENMIDGIYDLIKRSQQIKEEYEKILQQYSLTKEKFVDPYFQENKSDNPDITFERLEDHYGTDIFSNISESAIVQYELGDCFLVSALSHIA